MNRHGTIYFFLLTVKAGKGDQLGERSAKGGKVHPTREPCCLLPLPDCSAEQQRDGPVLRQGVHLTSAGPRRWCKQSYRPADGTRLGAWHLEEEEGGTSHRSTPGAGIGSLPPQGSGTRKGTSPVARPLEENIRGAHCEGETARLTASADGQQIPQPEGISLTSHARW